RQAVSVHCVLSSRTGRATRGRARRMGTQEGAMAGYGVPEFIGEVKAILAEDGSTDQALARIAERMRDLVTNPEIVAAEASSNVHVGGASSGPVYADDSGLTLMRARF